MRLLCLSILSGVVALMLFSCREERKIDVLGNINLKVMPTMKTENVYTLISDSGITQYRIKSPLWIVYDEIDTPIWRFPKGLFLEKFDKKFNVISSVACDSATYFKREQLWRLDGNVEMHNMAGPDGMQKFVTAFFDKPVRFAELGAGSLPLKACIEAGLAGGAEYFLIEQDDSYGRDPFDCLKDSRDHLISLGYADWF